jgi:hypothetical protein
MFENSALKNFVAHLGHELAFAQVLIRRNGAGFELRQVEDSAVVVEALRAVAVNDARALAQCTAGGEFRPLKSAPSLQRGWRLVAANETDLERALAQLYPGAVADWHAAQSDYPPVTHFRDYANRQSGMYRNIALLDDGQVAAVVRATCDARRCLKRRLWTVAGLEPDAAVAKSLIPCLEPCAILMDSARRTARIGEQESNRQS